MPLAAIKGAGAMILVTLLLTVASIAALPQSNPGAVSCAFSSTGTTNTTTDVATGVTLQQGSATCGTHQATISVLTVDMTTPNRSVQASVPPAVLPVWATNTAHVGAAFPLILPTAAMAAPPAGFTPQAGVNANLFTNCCAYLPTDLPLPGTYLRGLQITQGQVNVPVLGNAYMPCAQEGAACLAFQFDATLLIDAAGHALIRRIDDQSDLNALPPIVTAVTGSHMLVEGGQSVAPVCPGGVCSGEFYRANARTAVGVIRTGTLLIVAVDIGGASDGLQLDELAALFAGPLHAGTALNLDGGGSTTMATVTGGAVTIVNKPSDTGKHGCTTTAPSGNCERYVGTALLVGTTQATAARTAPPRPRTTKRRP